MINASLPANLQSIYGFVDSQLVSNMAERQLKQCSTLANARLVKLIYNVIENLGDTVLYIEKFEYKGTLLIFASERSLLKRRIYRYVLSLHARNANCTELYIDSITQARKRSLLPSGTSNNTSDAIGFLKKHGSLLTKCAWGIGISMIAVLAIVAFPATIVFLIISAVIYPFKRFFQKRRFQRNQMRMQTIVGIFERQFGITSRIDSGDSVNPWGVVKSKTPVPVLDSTPPAFS